MAGGGVPEWWKGLVSTTGVAVARFGVIDSASGGPPVDWMEEIASESVLRQAYTWLCERRRDHSPHDDVWDLRWRGGL